MGVHLQLPGWREVSFLSFKAAAATNVKVTQFISIVISQ